MRKLLAGLVVTLVALAVLAACARAAPTPTPPPPTPTSAPGATPTAPAEATPTRAPIPTPTPYVTPRPTPLPAVGVYRTYEEALKEWPNVIAAAKKEGTVVQYRFSLPAPGTAGTASDALFTKIYGIQVENIAGRSAEALARMQAEAASGRHTWDIRTAGSGSRGQYGPLGINVSAAFVAPGTLEAGVPWIVNPLMDRPWEGNNHTYTWNTMRLLINTDLVPPEREPKDYGDLTDPWWKNKIVADDMRSTGPQSDVVVPLYLDPKYGEKFIRGFIANVGKQYVGTAAVTAAVVKGEFAAAISSVGSLEPYTKLPKPWKWKLLSPAYGEGGFMLLSAVNRNAPHPNAARLFAEFLISRENDALRGQFWGTGVARYDTPVVDDVVFPKKMMPGVPPSMEFTMFELLKINQDKFDPLLKEAGK